MRAIVHDRYGSADVLYLAELPTPLPNDNQVLVKIHASSVNAGDWHLMRADPFLIRLMMGGLFRPKHRVLGSDVAGVVEAVGKEITRFRPGDEVMGVLAEAGFGAFAEYAIAPEKCLVPKPANVDFPDAAPVGVAALAALQAVRDQGKVQAGQTVLVNGASGGVGHFAVQIAKALGADVTGVASGRNQELVESAGADHFFDYTTGDITTTDRRFDGIVDAASFRNPTDYLPILKERGTYVFIGGSVSGMFRVMMAASGVKRRTGKTLTQFFSTSSQADLQTLADYLEAGNIRAVIDRHYALAEVPDAVRYVEAGHARGKVVITMD